MSNLIDGEGIFIESILDNNTVLQELWEVSKNDSTDPSMKAQIIGVQTQFNSFKFYFGVQLAFYCCNIVII